MNKLLFKSETSLLASHIEVRKKKNKILLAIEAFEEHKAWGEKLFPGDDRDYRIEQIPIEIIWDVRDENLLEKIESINSLESPLILFAYEGIKPKILISVNFIEKEALEHLEKNVVIFPNNPVEEKEKRIEEEEKKLLEIDPKTWNYGG